MDILQRPAVVFQDNIGRIDEANGSSAKNFRRWTHIVILYRYATEMVDSKYVSLVNLPAAERETPFLTKSLGPASITSEMRKMKLSTARNEKHTTLD